MQYLRQGDLLLKKVKSLPKKAELMSKGRDYVLAYGEHTGHKHVLKGSGFNIHIFDDVRFLEILRVTPLIHEEHREIVVEPGIYELGQEREYDYFLMESRGVED